MAVKIRLARYGKKNRPFYRVVAADSQYATCGRFIEQLGTYDPVPEKPEVKLKEDRVKYWLGVGAKPSDTVASLIKRHIVEEE